ncbi:MAG: hypothetical protein J6C17_04565 [Clostridia bacterium]|nr:hypothetical protein [Clostridia bacterium]
MKKFLALLLMAVMTVTCLAGCGDPVYDDLENYLNVEAVNVNINYKALTEELSKWETFETDAELATSLNDVLIPLVDASLTELNGINPETAEVKELKAKYVMVFESYKKGFEALSEGCVTQDEATINAGYESLGEGVELLDEYNAGLEALASEYGSEIEY